MAMANWMVDVMLFPSRSSQLPVQCNTLTRHLNWRVFQQSTNDEDRKDAGKKISPQAKTANCDQAWHNFRTQSFSKHAKYDGGSEWKHKDKKDFKPEFHAHRPVVRRASLWWLPQCQKPPRTWWSWRKVAPRSKRGKCAMARPLVPCRKRALRWRPQPK